MKYIDGNYGRQGSFTVMLAAIGFFAGAARAEMPTKAQTHQYDQEHSHAQRDIYELEEFTVVSTGTRTERLLTDVPIKTDVLGSDLFESAAVAELGQALELLNGARTEANCQNCGTAEIQLLGLPGNYNQILVDGLPLFTGVASVYGIDQIPTIFVERIEIVKGGGSALYGPGAVAGVINLIPEEPFESHGHVDFTYRSIDGEPAYQSQFVNYFVNEDKSFKAAIYGLVGNQNEYDANGDGFSELVERENQVIGTYLWWTPFEKTRFRFNYQYIGEERRGGDQLGRPNQFAQISEFLDTDYHWATLNWEQEFTDNFNFKLAASTVQLDRNSFYGGTGDEAIDPDLVVVTTQNPANGTYNGATPIDGGTDDEQRAFALFGDGTGTGGGSFNQFGDLATTSYYFDAQFEYSAGELGGTGTHNFIFGFQYEEEDLEDINRNAFGSFVSVLQDDKFDNFGVYAQDEWLITGNLELLPGFRFDKANTLDDWVFSPRIALRYTASNEVTLRANYSTGFLAPRVFSEDVHVDNLGGTPVDTVNADGLTEERSQTFALGVDFTPAALEGKLVTSLQVYYTILDDSFRVEEPNGGPGPNGRIKVERINTEGSTIYGVEWDLSYRFDENWSANAGLAYNKTRFDEDQEIFNGVFSDKYNKVPDWSGLLQLVYDNEALFDAFLALKWTGTMEVANANTETLEDSPDFFVVDFGISKSFELSNDIELTLRAGVNNIFDEYQDDLEVGAGRDSDYVYGPRYPRGFTLGGRIDF
ncbi:MAG: TonB-dependent receptor [Verrucomicrobiota bacterium]